MHTIHPTKCNFLKRICCSLLLITLTAPSFAHGGDLQNPSLKTEVALLHPFSVGLLSSKIAKTDIAISHEIWSRVRTRFHLAPPTHSKRYQRHIKQLSTSQGTVNALVKNATPYLYYVLEEVEKRGMPNEIALLPMIESTFDPGDRSHKGAVGLWQIMPVLGRMHGLKQNSSYDGRRDVYESTKVALDHLQYLHKRFDGNWPLALAAYNSGEFRVLKAMKRNRAANKPTDYWSLPLPKETQDYVPKLMAWVEIVRTPKSYGLSLPSIPNKPVFTRLNTGKPINMSQAAKLTNISETQLRKLNPGFKKSMDPKGPFHLVVPIQHASVIEEKFGATPVPITPAKKSSKKSPVVVAAAVKSETTEKTTPQLTTAENTQQATTEATQQATTKASQKATNEATTASTQKASSKSAVKSSKATSKKSKKTPVKKAKKSKKKKSSTKSTSGTHVVKKGESIPKISKRYGMSVKQFMAKNGLKSQSSVIKPGQKLKI